MQLFRTLAEIPASFGPTVVTIGNFDGIHLAHHALLAGAVERARQLNAHSMLITFDPHPLRLLRPDRPPKLITPLRHRLDLLCATGLDATLMLTFTPELAAMSPEQFARVILADGVHAVEIHEGFNFRFGCRAEGDTELLRDLGSSLGFEVNVYPPLKLRGHIVSSSQIRKLVQAGNMDGARRLLGRPFALRSTPASGRGFGTRYTVPTINLSPYPELLPADGVYVTRIRVNQEWFDAVTNVGNRPTFGEDSFAVESHLLGFHPLVLTPETPIELAFLKRLREERRFPSTEALKEQIGYDVKRALRYFQLVRRHAPRRLPPCE